MYNSVININLMIKSIFAFRKGGNTQYDVENALLANCVEYMNTVDSKV